MASKLIFALLKPNYFSISGGASKIPYFANPLSKISKSTMYSLLTVLIVLMNTLILYPRPVLSLFYKLLFFDIAFDTDFDLEFYIYSIL